MGDGRYAVANGRDPTDEAVPVLMNGAAAVAMLVGADAPLALEGARTQALINEWDFYKPIGWPSMAPTDRRPGLDAGVLQTASRVPAR